MSGIKSTGLQPAQAQQILNEVKNRLQISLQSPTRLLPGQPLIASIIPDAPTIDISELVNGVINLAWLEKDVLFKNLKAVDIPSLDTANAIDLNGDHILTQLQSDASNVIKQPFPLPPLSTTSVTQVPGLAAQLAGTITLPRLSLTLKIEWIVEKNGVQQTDGKDLVALNGLTNTSVSVLLPPIFRELRVDTLTNPGGEIFCLSAKVTLIIGSHTLSIKLGPTPVLQLPVLVPTIVALFSEPNFSVTDNSSAVILVPRHSLFSSAAPLFKELRKIESVLDSLQTLAGIAGFILGLREITSLLDHPRLRFIASDGIPHLGEIILKRKPWYDVFGEDENFEDRTSSLFIFGIPGTQVGFYNFRTFNEDGAFYEITLRNSVTVGTPPYDFLSLPDYFVAIRSFATAAERDMDPNRNTSPPVTFPAGRITRQWDEPDEENVWDDMIGSVRFIPDWLDKLKEDEIDKPTIINVLRCGLKRPGRPTSNG
jgi:hypothetical protein